MKVFSLVHVKLIENIYKYNFCLYQCIRTVSVGYIEAPEVIFPAIPTALIGRHIPSWAGSRCQAGAALKVRQVTCVGKK